MTQVTKTPKTCCGAPAKEREHPDHSAEISRLNRIQGQLEGIKRMIVERTYCPDILTQTSAVKAAVSSLESVILEKHLSHCVRDAFKAGKGADEKIAELVDLFKKGAR